MRKVFDIFLQAARPRRVCVCQGPLLRACRRSPLQTQSCRGRASCCCHRTTRSRVFASRTNSSRETRDCVKIHGRVECLYAKGPIHELVDGAPCIQVSQVAVDLAAIEPLLMLMEALMISELVLDKVSRNNNNGHPHCSMPRLQILAAARIIITISSSSSFWSSSSSSSSRINSSRETTRD